MTAGQIAFKPAAISNWALALVSVAGIAVGAAVGWNASVTAVVFFTLCACTLSWTKPVAVICGLAFYIPIERFITVGLSDQAFVISQVAGEVVLIALLTGILARRVASGKRLVATPLDLALIAFVAVCLLSALVNRVGPTSTVYGIRIVLRYAVLFYAIANGGFSRREIKYMVGAYFAAAGLQIGVGLMQALTAGAAKELFTGTHEVTIGKVGFTRGQNVMGAGQRLHTVIFGTMENYNGYGMFLAGAWLVAFSMLRARTRALGSGRLWAVVVLGFACVVLSFSRSSLLVLILGSIVVSYLAGYKRWALSLAFLLLAGLASIIYLGTQFSGQELPVLSNNIVYRWVREFTPERLVFREAGNYRLFLLFVISVRILSQSPILGLGPGTFGSALTLLPGQELYAKLGMNSEYAVLFAADSNWTTIMAQTGLVGLFFFALIVFGMSAYSARILKRTSDPLLRGVCLAQIGLTVLVVVAGFFGPFFESRSTSFYYWALGGMVVGLARAQGIGGGRSWLSRVTRPAWWSSDGAGAPVAARDFKNQ
jgi:hypothetical protein